MNTGADDNDCDCTLSPCSLRDAVCLASQTPESDDIFIDPSVTDMVVDIACSLGPEDDNVCGDIDVFDIIPNTTIRIIAPGGLSVATLGSSLVGSERERLLHVPPPTEERFAPTLWIEGIKVMGGTELASGGPGGCIANESTSTLRLRQSEVVGCLRDGSSSGGAIGGGGVFTQGPLVMQSSWVGQNVSRHSDGGGIYATSNVTVQEGGVVGNSAELNCIGCTVSGGGLYASGSGIVVSVADALFESNQCLGDGGGLYVGGAAVSAQVSGSSVETNQAFGSGGGLFVDGSNAQTNLAQTLFDGNESSGQGGGVYAAGLHAYFDEVKAHGNSAVADGGGIYAETGDFFAAGLDIGDNAAGGHGGGVYTLAPEVGGPFIRQSSFWHNTSDDKGGGLYIQTRDGGTTEHRIDNTTFSENEAAVDGGSIAMEPPTGKTSSHTFLLRHVTVFESAVLASGHVGRDIFAAVVGTVEWIRSLLYSLDDEDDCGGGASFGSDGITYSWQTITTSGCVSTGAQFSATGPLGLTYAGHGTKIHPLQTNGSDPRVKNCDGPILAVDQHGSSRLLGGDATCGAWEAP